MHGSESPIRPEEVDAAFEKASVGAFEQKPVLSDANIVAMENVFGQADIEKKLGDYLNSKYRDIFEPLMLLSYTGDKKARIEIQKEIARLADTDPELKKIWEQVKQKSNRTEAASV